MNGLDAVFMAIGSLLCFGAARFAYSKKSLYKSKPARFFLGIVTTPFIFYVWLGFGFEKVEYFYPALVLSAIIGAITQSVKNTDAE